VLLQSGHAYRCFCASERLNELARQRNQLRLSSDYDRTCAGILKEESDERASKGEAHVIRLKAPATPPDYFDIVYGAVGQSKSKKSPLNRGEPTYDDSVLIKSDGLPTYHLANVVDDHHMKITHVIRASEWMTSTPKHLFMYKAFGWEPPHFAHVGLLQDIERQKFSKRNADLDIRTFENDGIFPEALVNYVALHGWSHNLGNDFLSLQDLVQNFDLKFTKGDTMVQPTKLMYLQKKYARKHVEEGGAVYESMVDRVYDIAEQRIGLEEKDIEFRNRIAAFMRLVPEAYTTPKNFYERHIALFELVERPKYIPTKDNNGQELVWNVDSLSSINDVFTKPPSRDSTPWTASETKELVNRAISSLSILSALHTTTDKAGTFEKTEALKAGSEEEYLYNAAVNHYLRWAIMGGKPGPAVADSMVLLGREETMKRMQDAARILGVSK
jgi:glutamyl-tRNA synthetase